MFRLLRLICIQVVAVVLLLNVTTSQTQSEALDYSALRKKALSLRNTDPHVKKKGEWIEVVEALETFASRSDEVDAPSALMNSARMRISIAEESGDEKEKVRAITVLEDVAERFPTSQLADDALALLGDLALKSGDSSEAQKLYQNLVERFPNSDLYEYALGKIEIIDRGQQRTQGARKQGVTGSGPLIVIDPGHGGEDLGAVGVSGLLEKDVVLDIATALERILRESLDARVILTRTTDVFVPLQRRMEMANEAGADLFISLHTNASESKSLSGFESYYLDAEGDASSKLLAERENASDGGQLDDISFMISDLIQASKIPESRTLAESIQKGVIGHLSPRWEGIRSLKVKKAPFYVLVGAHMPSVLVEMFFIDHPTDGIRLADKEFRENIAHGIFLGIKSYSSR